MEIPLIQGDIEKNLELYYEQHKVLHRFKALANEAEDFEQELLADEKLQVLMEMRENEEDAEY